MKVNFKDDLDFIKEVEKQAPEEALIKIINRFLLLENAEIEPDPDYPTLTPNQFLEKFRIAIVDLSKKVSPETLQEQNERLMEKLPNDYKEIFPEPSRIKEHKISKHFFGKIDTTLTILRFYRASAKKNTGEMTTAYNAIISALSKNTYVVRSSGIKTNFVTFLNDQMLKEKLISPTIKNFNDIPEEIVLILLEGSLTKWLNNRNDELTNILLDGRNEEKLIKLLELLENLNSKKEYISYWHKATYQTVEAEASISKSMKTTKEILAQIEAAIEPLQDELTINKEVKIAGLNLNEQTPRFRIALCELDKAKDFHETYQCVDGLKDYEIKPPQKKQALKKILNTRLINRWVEEGKHSLSTIADYVESEEDAKQVILGLIHNYNALLSLSKSELQNIFKLSKHTDTDKKILIKSILETLRNNTDIVTNSYTLFDKELEFSEPFTSTELQEFHEHLKKENYKNLTPEQVVKLLTKLSGKYTAPNTKEAIWIEHIDFLQDRTDLIPKDYHEIRKIQAYHAMKEATQAAEDLLSIAGYDVDDQDLRKVVSLCHELYSLAIQDIKNDPSLNSLYQPVFESMINLLAHSLLRDRKATNANDKLIEELRKKTDSTISTLDDLFEKFKNTCNTLVRRIAEQKKTTGSKFHETYGTIENFLNETKDQKTLEAFQKEITDRAWGLIQAKNICNNFLNQDETLLKKFGETVPMNYYDSKIECQKALNAIEISNCCKEIAQAERGSEDTLFKKLEGLIKDNIPEFTLPEKAAKMFSLKLNLYLLDNFSPENPLIKNIAWLNTLCGDSSKKFENIYIFITDFKAVLKDKADLEEAPNDNPEPSTPELQGMIAKADACMEQLEKMGQSRSNFGIALAKAKDYFLGLLLCANNTDTEIPASRKEKDITSSSTECKQLVQAAINFLKGNSTKDLTEVLKIKYTGHDPVTQYRFIELKCNMIKHFCDNHLTKKKEDQKDRFYVACRTFLTETQKTALASPSVALKTMIAYRCEGLITLENLLPEIKQTIQAIKEDAQKDETALAGPSAESIREDQTKPEAAPARPSASTLPGSQNNSSSNRTSDASSDEEFVIVGKKDLDEPEEIEQDKREPDQTKESAKNGRKKLIGNIGAFFSIKNKKQGTKRFQNTNNEQSEENPKDFLPGQKPK